VSLVILHTAGAKSGEPRETPLFYRQEGDDVVVFASKGGAPENPAWYHNVLAHPEVTVELGDGTRTMRARVAEGDERDRIWSAQKDEWPQFAEYETKTDRAIPVVILEPVA
jgi:deazaflavin-dependent oxidoreductase (nitroreductase family)